MDWDFLKKFIPHAEMAVILQHPEAYADALEDVERQLRSLPRPWEIVEPHPKEIRIWAHYFAGASDWWLYALEDDLEYASAFVCLNGDTENAETGPVYIPEFLPIPLVNLDLYWNDKTTLQEVMDKVGTEK